MDKEMRDRIKQRWKDMPRKIVIGLMMLSYLFGQSIGFIMGYFIGGAK